MISCRLYEIRNLVHCYQGRSVLEIPSMQIQQKSIVGLIGPNGGGKSTLLKLLACVESPGSGEILFKGRRMKPFADDTRFQITLLPQEPYLLKRNVHNNIAYGLRLRKDKTSNTRKVFEALELVGLDPKSFHLRPWQALSGGEARRVTLAARLALHPEVLLLDEPTAGIDAASVQLIKEAVLRAREEWNTTLIIASHDWEWIEMTCDDILHLSGGRILDSDKGNIIFGPWHPRRDGWHEKHLRDGQSILVPPPPGKNAAVLMKSEDLRVCTDQPITGDNEHLLKAMITHMTLEKKSGNILLTLNAGHQDVTVRISHSHSKAGHFQPGLSVWLIYNPKDMKWIH